MGELTQHNDHLNWIQLSIAMTFGYTQGKLLLFAITKEITDLDST